MKLTIGLPSGVGDCSWALSKLHAVRSQIKEIKIADGWPYRTDSYIHLYWSEAERLARPNNGASYGTFQYKEIQVFEHVNGLASIPGYSPTWADVMEKVGGYGEILLQPNAHLEAGKWLRQWLSDLPTEYHYPLYTTKKHEDFADNLMMALRLKAKPDWNAPLVAVSCASYRGSEAWKTWGSEQWVAFLRLVMGAGWQPVMMGGYWDDLTSNVAAELDLPCWVGKTEWGQAVEMLKRFDAFIGFSSGLGMVRTVLDKPALLLWPDFQKELSTSWAPPDMLSSGRYVAAPWRDPTVDTWPVTKRFLAQCEEERHGKGTQKGQGQEA